MKREPHEGLRERKRRETLQRITDAALKLFSVQGFEATTLDAIAEAADISRRTFFYYFKSKEEILAAWQSGLPEALRTAILEEPKGQPPMKVLQNVLLKAMTAFDPAQARVIGEIVRDSAQLQASNQVKYMRLENAAFEALIELWPEPDRRDRLRLVAMVGVSALRLAISKWVEGSGDQSPDATLREIFAHLDELCADSAR